MRRPALGAASVFATLVLTALWGVGVFGGNVRTVVPGRVYRSAQLTGRDLDSVLDADHVRTVINLRGPAPHDNWYTSELASCRERGVVHVDVALSATHLPPPAQLRTLLSAFDRSPYPVLFHCQAGADRSGLVGTLYLTTYRGVPLDRAQASQLTWRYGHVSWGKAHAMDDFFRLYRATGAGLSLRDWITSRYPSVYKTGG